MKIKILLMCSFLMIFLPVYAEEVTPEKIFDMPLEELMDIDLTVITATKTLEDIRKSGATVTVITAREIRNMGARNLMDVLRTVPGIGVTLNAFGLPDIESRGVKNPVTSKILFMLNSHPLNNPSTGATSFFYEEFIVDNIKRVEVIRGPGSALYGANAFLAIINIITKDAKDIDGVELTLGGGSYETKKANLLFGKTINDIEIVANIHVFDTDGFHGFVEQDFQTVLDNIMGTSASLAPGYTDIWKKRYDFDLKLKYRDLFFQGKYLKRESGPYVGTGHALNDETLTQDETIFLELGYTKEITSNFDIAAKTYHDYFSSDHYYELFPEGYAGLFPEGYIGEPFLKTTKTGGEFQGTWDMGNGNKALAGISAEHQNQYDVGQKTNYNPLTGAPLGSFQDISDQWNWNKAVNRNFFAVFAEDIWDIREDLRIILGARYDYYTDFGGSFNPRTSLTWEFLKDYYASFHYGTKPSVKQITLYILKSCSGFFLEIPSSPDII